MAYLLGQGEKWLKQCRHFPDKRKGGQFVILGGRWMPITNSRYHFSEYDAVARLGINDPRSYLKTRLASQKVLFLQTVCVGRGLVEQMLGHVEETLDSNEWSDVTVSELDAITTCGNSICNE